MIHPTGRLSKAVLTVSFAVTCVAWAAPANPSASLKIQRSVHTGLASFVTARDGGAIPMQSVPAFRPIQPGDFLREHGALFGVTDPAKQLVLDGTRTKTDAEGLTHTTYREVHKGVDVFAGVLKVHQDGFGAVISANGDFFPILNALDTVPTLSVDDAILRGSIED